MGGCGSSSKSADAVNKNAPANLRQIQDRALVTNENENVMPPENLPPQAEKLILLLCGDFSEDYEVMVPFQALQAFGYKVHAVCPNKSSGEVIRTAIFDFEEDDTTDKPKRFQTYTEKRGHNFTLNYCMADVNVDDYVGLIIPGGRSPEYLAQDQAVVDVVKAFIAADKPIAANSNGQLILAAAGGIQGKTCTAYPTLKSAIEKAQGTYAETNEWMTLAITTENLVTASAWAAHPEMLKQFTGLLGMKAYQTQRKVLFLCGDYMEDYEVMIPYQTLLSIGYRVHTVCPGKEPESQCFTAVHDFEGDQTYTEKPGHFFSINTKFEEVNVEDYDGLVIPGGRAPEYLAMDEKVLKIVKDFFEADKPVASICHGQQILVAADVLKEKKCTAYPACKAQVVASEADWQDPEPISMAVTDGKLVTAAAWPGHPEFMKQFIATMGSTIVLSSNP
mmetsp:Transcript_2725/g.3880  ORF Transcript_2725/g.3880 Transcript_2725/m.3880 type:complete len:448 (+) Transcript_2725:68-1411(+)